MTLTSRRKNIPVLAVFGILVSALFAFYGAMRIGEGDLMKVWGNIFIGFCLLVSWTEKLRSQVIQIVIDDSEIRFRRRYRPDSVIRRDDLIDSEVSSSRIKFRYKGPLDVQSASIPLRRFSKQEVGPLVKIFVEENKNAQQAVDGNPH